MARTGPRLLDRRVAATAPGEDLVPLSETIVVTARDPTSRLARRMFESTGAFAERTDVVVGAEVDVCTTHVDDRTGSLDPPSR